MSFPRQAQWRSGIALRPEYKAERLCLDQRTGLADIPFIHELRIVDDGMYSPRRSAMLDGHRVANFYNLTGCV